MSEKKWLVVTFTDFYYKIYHEVETEEMAMEYASKILERGDLYESKGITTFIPTSRIMKVIVRLAGEEEASKHYVKFTGE